VKPVQRRKENSNHEEFSQLPRRFRFDVLYFFTRQKFQLPKIFNEGQKKANEWLAKANKGLSRPIKAKAAEKFFSAMIS
jgi:hypothetical protein